MDSAGIVGLKIARAFGPRRKNASRSQAESSYTKGSPNNFYLYSGNIAGTDGNDALIDKFLMRRVVATP
jgi:hypothetical protein